MKKCKNLNIGLACVALMSSSIAHSAIITFDEVISGSTSFGFDGDGDLIDDVVFSTTDTLGFNTVGPGTNMSFISEPGLEGTTTIFPDLRVDFSNGAVTNLSFSFAVSGIFDGVDGVTFRVFDSSDNLINSLIENANSTLPDGINPSNFPEALVSLDFAGIASYATFDFSNNDASRYILDNFSGTFGSTEDITPKDITPSTVPEPTSLALLVFGLAGISFSRKKKAV